MSRITDGKSIGAGFASIGNTEAADIAGVDVERYKRLAVQQEKSITALQARNQESEARARDGALNADMVDQLRSERDQISLLVRSHEYLVASTLDVLCESASGRPVCCFANNWHMRQCVVFCRYTYACARACRS